MTISLSQETQKLLEKKLSAGRYGSADEVLQAALEALTERESGWLNPETIAAIGRADEQVAQGQVHEWTAVREQTRAKFQGK